MTPWMPRWFVLLVLMLPFLPAVADTEEARQGRFKMSAKVDAEGSKVMAEAMLPELFAPNLPAGTPIIDQTRKLMLNTEPAGIIGALQGMAARLDCGALLPKISVPVLILAGDQDQIIPPDKAKAMAAALKTATLTMIEHAGHMPMLEQPAATTAAIRQFFSKLGN